MLVYRIFGLLGIPSPLHGIRDFRQVIIANETGRG